MSDKERSAKLKALELTLGKLEKSYGKGVVMKLGDKVGESGSESTLRLRFGSL